MFLLHKNKTQTSQVTSNQHLKKKKQPGDQVMICLAENNKNTLPWFRPLRSPLKGDMGSNNYPRDISFLQHPITRGILTVIHNLKKNRKEKKLVFGLHKKKSFQFIFQVLVKGGR